MGVVPNHASGQAGLRYGTALFGPLTLDLDPPRHPAERAGIVNRQVFDATIVPEGDRPRRIAEPAGELCPVAVVQQIAQQRLAFFLGHALEPHAVGVVDEQRFPAGFGVDDGGGVDVDGFAPIRVLPHRSGATFADSSARAGDIATTIASHFRK